MSPCHTSPDAHGWARLDSVLYSQERARMRAHSQRQMATDHGVRMHMPVCILHHQERAWRDPRDPCIRGFHTAIASPPSRLLRIPFLTLGALDLHQLHSGPIVCGSSRLCDTRGSSSSVPAGYRPVPWCFLEPMVELCEQRASSIAATVHPAAEYTNVPQDLTVTQPRDFRRAEEVSYCQLSSCSNGRRRRQRCLRLAPSRCRLEKTERRVQSRCIWETSA
jgi:hypothetical protein